MKLKSAKQLQEIENRGLAYRLDEANKAKRRELVKRGYLTPLDMEAPHDFNINKAVMNYLPSAGRAVGDFANAVIHPIDTGTAIKDLAVGVGQKFTEGVGDKEYIADAVGQHFSDRLGSWDKIKRTLENDPFGFQLDMSAGLGAVSKLPMLSRVGKVANVVDPVNVGVNVARKAAGTLYNKSKPIQMMADAVKYNVGGSNTIAKNLKKAEALLRENIPLTYKGVTKAWDMVESLQAQVTKLIKIAGDTGMKIPRAFLFDSIQEAWRNARKGGNPKAEAAQIQRYYDDLMEIWKADNRPDFSLEELQAWKIDTYELVRYDKGEITRGLELGRRAAASGAREKLGEKVPELHGINRREGDLLNALDGLEQKVQVIERRNSLPLPAAGNVGVGAYIGDMSGVPYVGMGVGAAATLWDMPLPKSKMAQMLWNIKHTGIADPRMFPFLRRGMYEGGKLEADLPPLPPFIGADGVIQKNEDKEIEKNMQRIGDEQNKQRLQESLAQPVYN